VNAQILCNCSQAIGLCDHQSQKVLRLLDVHAVVEQQSRRRRPQRMRRVDSVFDFRPVFDPFFLHRPGQPAQVALDHAVHCGRVHRIANNSLSHTILSVRVNLLFAVAVRKRN
jgi:hypothetical protein